MRFCSSSPDKRSVFGGGCPLSPGGEVATHRIMEEGRVDLRIEDLTVEFDLPHLLMVDVIDG
jgi:hypothetical protein